MDRTFLALSTFYSPEFKSTYAQGLTYTIKHGNRYLNALAEVWKVEGKIEFIHEKNVATVIGKGYTDPTIWAKTLNIWNTLWR